MNTMSSHHGRHKKKTRYRKLTLFSNCTLVYKWMGGGDQGLYDPKNEHWKPSLFEQIF